MRLLLVAAVWLAAGCLRDELVACSGDTLCPAGLSCDTVHGGCITSEQASACIGMADQTACRAGEVHGYCLDEICIDPGCGNHLIDDGELCDDGNRNDGDGCNATCTSRETCGDGALDRDLDEECDDGNLMSHDGCDSRCLPETEEWSVDELGPSSAITCHMVFDPTRGEVVVLDDDYLWGWNGTRWHVLSSDLPTIRGAFCVGYDESRLSIVVFGARGQTSDFLDPDPPWDQVYEWDGTIWTQFTIANPPDVFKLAMTFDPVDKKLFAIGIHADNMLFAGELDLAAKAWTPIAPPTAATHADAGIAAAFDVKRGRLVVVTAGDLVDDPTVHEWNGSTWVSTTKPMTARRDWGLLYDAQLQSVLAIGTDVVDATSTPVQAWNGSAWTTLPSIPFGYELPSIAFDTARNARVVFGGTDPQDQVSEAIGGTWALVARRAPSLGPDSACAFDEPGQRLICTGKLFGSGRPELWAYDTQWTLLDRGVPGGDTPQAITFDPLRNKIVGLQVPGFVELVGTQWQAIPTSFTLSSAARAMLFDPIGKRDVVVGQPLIVGFSFTGFLTADNQVTSMTTDAFSSLAYDGRSHEVFAMRIGGDAFHLVGDAWAPVVGPGSGNTPVTNARRGTIEFFAPDQLSIERIGTQWLTHTTPVPVALTGSAAMNQTTGELHIIGQHSNSRFMLHRRWVSQTPTEDCATADDVDGDGLHGCDDPDCWTTCTPACPPYVVCP